MDTTAVLVEPTAELKPLASFRALPGDRGRASPRTLLGWVTRGVTIGGQVLRLRAERIGGRWFARAEWVSAFIAATTAAATGQEPPKAE